MMIFLLCFPFIKTKMEKHGKILWHFSISSLLAAFCICFVASDFAIINRYLTDYLYLISLPVIFIIICLYEIFRKAGLEKSIQGFLLICGLIQLGLFTALSFSGEDNWFQTINPLYYDKLRYAMSPWL